MKTESFKIILLPLLATVTIFLTIVDSGGEQSLRLIAISIVFILALSQYARGFDAYNFLAYILLALLLSLSSLQSVVAGVEIKSIIPWIFPLLSLPIFIAFSRGAKVKSEHFIAAGAFFALLVIFLFIGRLTGNALLLEINELLTSEARGFFNYKQAFLSYELPVVYFQGTLNLVFIGVLAWCYRKYSVFVFILLALVVAPSRFGVFTLCLFALIFMIARALKFRYVIIGFFGVAVIFILFILILSMETANPNLLNIYEIDPVRAGHITSVYKTIEENPSQLITGAGPGSLFFSSGFGLYTDNIEISQLELIRKYGVIFFLFAHVIVFILIYRLVKLNKHAEIFALIAHYFVSLSNPALLSIPFLLFLAYLIAESSGDKSRSSVNIPQQPESISSHHRNLCKSNPHEGFT